MNIKLNFCKKYYYVKNTIEKILQKNIINKIYSNIKTIK